MKKLCMIFFLYVSSIPIVLSAGSLEEVFDRLILQQQQGKLCAYDLPGIAQLQMPEIIKRFLQSAEISKENIVLADQEV